MEQVILVNQNDEEIGLQEKVAAHLGAGQLHRAFSIFLFNSFGEVMLQKRARSKYHNGGLWSNACCGHPRPGEGTAEAAQRRLKEEMGTTCKIKEVFPLTYKASFDNGLVEHEFDHFFIGKFDGEPNPNLEEAEDWKWISAVKLKKDIKLNSEKYTQWFVIGLPKILRYVEKKQ